MIALWTKWLSPIEDLYSFCVLAAYTTACRSIMYPPNSTGLRRQSGLAKQSDYTTGKQASFTPPPPVAGTSVLLSGFLCIRHAQPTCYNVGPCTTSETFLIDHSMSPSCTRTLSTVTLSPPKLGRTLIHSRFTTLSHASSQLSRTISSAIVEPCTALPPAASSALYRRDVVNKSTWARPKVPNVY